MIDNKILVLNPPSAFRKNTIRDVLYGCWCAGKRVGRATTPPFVLIGIATILKNNNLNVDFIDASAQRSGREYLGEIIKGYGIAIISTSTMTVNDDAQYLGYLKRMNPSLVTVAFGSHPTYMPEDTLNKKGIDIIVRNEPEFVIRDLTKALTGDNGWKGIRGIGYKDASGKIVINPAYPSIENLDELPVLDTSFLPKNALYFNPIIKKFPYITLSTSRGCLAQCIFCSAPFFEGPRYRYQSPERVLRELKVHSKNNFKTIYFRDATFTADRQRVIEICKEIIKQKLAISWVCNSRVGLVNEEMLSLMKKAGCYLIKFGVESGVQRILDNSKKGIKVTDIERTFKLCKEAGIDTHAHIMIGMPGDTQETVKKTIQFVCAIKPTTASFGICTPYPGTPLFEYVKNKCSEIKDGSGINLKVLHVRGDYNKYYCDIYGRKLKKYLLYAYRKFYLRPGYIVKLFKNQIKSKQDFKRIFISGVNIIDFAIRGE
jgi:radical SAM superfamily enzyme YgiQ (UPF0313 family)